MHKLDSALQVIEHFESLSLRSYICPAGVPTIGWGSTRWFDNSPIRMGMTCTLDEARQLLLRDVSHSNNVVNRWVTVPLRFWEQNALVSFVHNVGEGHFRHSTLLRYLNDGSGDEVPAQLLRWTRGADRQVLPGLLRRRRTEAHLYKTGKIRFEHGNPVFPELKIGDRGPEVKQLQRALGGNVPVTGYFGSITHAALVAYQTQNGLVPNGIVTPPIVAALGLLV